MTLEDLYFPDDFGDLVTTASAAELVAALPPEVRDEFLDKHRDRNVDHDWWDGVYEQFSKKMTEAGIELDLRAVRLGNGKTRYDPAVYFSGFSSQGDGACFEGRVGDWPKILADLAAQNKGLQCFADIYDASMDLIFSCSHHGNYYHSSSIKYDYVFEVSNYWDKETDHLRHLAYQALLNECESKVGVLWVALIEVFRDYMDQLYKDLEEEHDYLTSDEVLVEGLDMDDVEELICEEGLI